MPRPPHPPRLDYYNYTWRRVQIMKLLVMQFSGLCPSSGILNTRKHFLVFFVFLAFRSSRNPLLLKLDVI
jgi:hypothetical protein